MNIVVIPTEKIAEVQSLSTEHRRVNFINLKNGGKAVPENMVQDAVNWSDLIAVVGDVPVSVVRLDEIEIPELVDM